MDLLISRRNLLARIGAAVALPALSGCVKHLSAPTPIQCKDASAAVLPPELIIDAHCHIVNGTDLQVALFLKRIANLEWACAISTPRIPQPIMDIVADLLQSSVWNNAPDATRELQLIEPLIQCNPDPSVRMAIADREFDRQQQDAHLAVQKSILASPKMKAFSGAKAGTTPLSQSSEVTEDNTLAEIHDRVMTASPAEYHEMRRSRKTSRTANTTQAKAQDAVDGALEYVYQGFQYRFISVLAYQRTFQNTPSADLMVAALVNYDWWLAGGKPTRTPLQDQVNLMSRLSVLTGGQVHALVPFDPLREVASRAHKGKHAWSSLEFVQQAVREQGCVGVKLYPPMGFAAYGNSALSPQFWSGHNLPGWVNHPVNYKDGKPPLSIGDRLDEALADLYSWCIAEDVPVMAHSSASNGVSRAFMDPADAKYWGLALAKFPALRISFGHTGDFSDPRACGYPDQSHAFAALMGKASPVPGVNAYADTGYFSEVLSATDGAPKLLEQFRTFYTKRRRRMPLPSTAG